jgi:hypothetical protein
MFGLPLLIGMFGNAGPLPEGYLRQMFQYYVIVLLFSVHSCWISITWCHLVSECVEIASTGVD